MLRRDNFTVYDPASLVMGVTTPPHLGPEKHMTVQLLLLLHDPSPVNLLVLSCVLKSHLFILFSCHQAHLATFVCFQDHHLLFLYPLLESSQAILLILCEVTLHLSLLVAYFLCVLLVDLLCGSSSHFNQGFIPCVHGLGECYPSTLLEVSHLSFPVIKDSTLRVVYLPSFSLQLLHLFLCLLIFLSFLSNPLIITQSLLSLLIDGHPCLGISHLLF